MLSPVITAAGLVTGGLRVWRMIENGAYAAQTLPPDGIARSQVFPELWLDVAAFWADDGARMLAALNAGLASAK